MIALDTNVIVRVVTQDDPKQARAAAALMRSGPFLVTKTVLVEVAWVLARAYGLDRLSVSTALRTLVGIETARVEDREAVVQALAWHAAGLGISDAVHLASSSDTVALATFDERFVRLAARLHCRPVVRLVGGIARDAVGEPGGQPYRAGRAARKGPIRRRAK